MHELVAAYCGNKSMAAMIADARRRARLCNVERLSQRAVQARAEHLAIVQALQAGDAERARATMTAHLGAVRRAFARTLGYLPHED
ncbi:FCD domain-containing protein [Achromobacter xylosoxidans]